MVSELVARLRAEAESLERGLLGKSDFKLTEAETMREAADRIEALEAALEPFVAEADLIDQIAAQSDDEYDKPMSAWSDDSLATVRVRSLRRARDAIRSRTTEGENG